MQPNPEIVEIYDAAPWVLANPSSAAVKWIVGLSVAALAVGGTVVYMRRKKASAAAKVPGGTNGTPSGGGTTGGGGGGTQGKYVGTGWTGWPHKDRFPNEASFGEVLRQLGYERSAGVSPWKARSPDAIQDVKDFQYDWNVFIQTQDPGILATTASHTMFFRRLTIDGKLGNDTVQALRTALFVSIGAPWFDLVNDASVS